MVPIFGLEKNNLEKGTEFEKNKDNEMRQKSTSGQLWSEWTFNNFYFEEINL